MDITGFILEYKRLISIYGMQDVVKVEIDITKFIVDTLHLFKMTSFPNGDFIVGNENDILEYQILGITKEFETGKEPRIRNILFIFDGKGVNVTVDREEVQKRLIEIL